jgi:hypothetical protein
MTGRKTLGEVQAELEAALGAGPAGEGQVAESLRRFLAAGAGKGKSESSDPVLPRPVGSQTPSSNQITQPPAAEHGR